MLILHVNWKGSQEAYNSQNNSIVGIAAKPQILKWAKLMVAQIGKKNTKTINKR